jgi:hypothetical protein
MRYPRYLINETLSECNVSTRHVLKTKNHMGYAKISRKLNENLLLCTVQKYKSRRPRRRRGEVN